ncbi:hypothetical protein VTL71DRAFT_9683 [Oculimacula yallundae]|uniref:Zn(2)-C6 fungal-type domain-containing protein n=1 Tax=Oculimacula yallundae TaxID=86028 RepID=A0ABR4BRN8_9HELO
MSTAAVASSQSFDSIYKQLKSPFVSNGESSSTNKTSSEEPASAMESPLEPEDGSIKEPYWGEETDYIFYVDHLKLPKLSTDENESNAKVLAKMMRQKLVYKIKSHCGLEPRKRLGDNDYLDPLQSDPAPPYFYEWRFTPEYPSFPLRPLAKWRLYDTKACNMALDNGDLYLVDVRNPGPRPPRKDGAVAPAGIRVPGGGGENRERLVKLAEAAFSRYIVLETGITVFDYRDVLDGSGRGPPGWKWIFPTTGIMSKFPEIRNFWNWSTDEILHALHALLTKTLRLERLDPSEFNAVEFRGLPKAALEVQKAPEPAAPRPQYYPTPPISRAPPTNNYHNPINLEAPNPVPTGNQTVSGLNAAAIPRLSGVNSITPVVHALDDLVTQLSARSQLWKQDYTELQASLARERTLAKSNSKQASRIDVLERALCEIERLGANINGTGRPAPQVAPAIAVDSAMAGMEAFYKGEISELKAQNEELKEVIQGQEEDLQNAIWLRERNRELESQLAEKTKEAESAYEALSALSGSNALSKDTGISANGLSLSQGKCDRCLRKGRFCVNPGGPCVGCKSIQKSCTFDKSLALDDALTKARKATESASQFLQRREYTSPYFTPEQRLSQSKEATSQSRGVSQQEQQVQRAINSPQVLPKATHAHSLQTSTNGSSSSTPQPPPKIYDTPQQMAAAAPALESTEMRIDDALQSPYVADSFMADSWEGTAAEINKHFN